MSMKKAGGRHGSVAVTPGPTTSRPAKLLAANQVRSSRYQQYNDNTPGAKCNLKELPGRSREFSNSNSPGMPISYRAP